MSPRPLLDPSPSPSPPPVLALSPSSPLPPPVPSSLHDALLIYDQLTQLRCPSDDDDWVNCFVRAKDFEHIHAIWATVCHLPQFHLVGKSQDGYTVAVAVFALPLLNRHEVPYSQADGDLSGYWRPRQDASSETRLGFGSDSDSDSDFRSASRSASPSPSPSHTDRQWFVQNAIAGISTRARGLVDLYRGLFKYWPMTSGDLRVPIEWAILLRDIKNASPTVLETFCCSFLLLDRLLHDAMHPWQTPMDVIERLCRADIEMATVPPSFQDEAKHMHQISLLRTLLEHAQGQRDVRQHRLDKSRSANDNLRDLCELYCSNVALSHAPRSVCEHRLHPATCGIAPFRFESSLYAILPAALIDNLAYSSVEATLLLRQLPHDGPEALPLFLCQYTSMEKDYSSLFVWMASAEGVGKRGEIVQLLHDAQTRRQKWIYLGALMCFERVLDNSGVAAMEWSFFSRFGHAESETLWHHVANCLYQIAHCDVDAVSWLVDEEWQPSQSMDHRLVLYWHLRDSVNHETASTIFMLVSSADRNAEKISDSI